MQLAELRSLASARLEDRLRCMSMSALAALLPPLELGGDLGEAALHPLRAGVADVRELLGEHRLGFAREVAH